MKETVSSGASGGYGILKLVASVAGAFVIAAALSGCAGTYSSQDASGDVAASDSTQADSTSLTPTECSSIHVDITLVNNTLSNASFTPSQAAQLLNRASSDWASAAAQATGSESDWLSKMSELSADVGSFILTGSPADGQTKLDQLYNNMDLYSQFCQ